MSWNTVTDLIFDLVAVFASLVEYAAVGYMLKRHRRRVGHAAYWFNSNKPKNWSISAEDSKTASFNRIQIIKVFSKLTATLRPRPWPTSRRSRQRYHRLTVCYFVITMQFLEDFVILTQSQVEWETAATGCGGTTIDPWRTASTFRCVPGFANLIFKDLATAHCLSLALDYLLSGCMGIA